MRGTSAGGGRVATGWLDGSGRGDGEAGSELPSHAVEGRRRGGGGHRSARPTGRQLPGPSARGRMAPPLAASRAWPKRWRPFLLFFKKN